MELTRAHGARFRRKHTTVAPRMSTGIRQLPLTALVIGLLTGRTDVGGGIHFVYGRAGVANAEGTSSP